MITTGYDADSRISSLTYPDGTVVTRGYTDRNQLSQLTYAGTVVDTRTYDNGKRMIGSTYNNGVGETRVYNADNTLAAINFSGAAIGNLSYTWDANKNKTAETIGGTMSGYGFTIPGGGYDTEDRLISYTRTDGALAQSWNLSPVGDWNSVTTNSVAQNRTHGPTHELTAINTTAILHDTKGNITQNSSGHLYTWDFDNRLQGANTDGQPGDEVTYKFDALGRRISRDDGATATVFVPSGQQTIADYPSGELPASPTYNYVYASYIDEPILRHQPATSTTLYYHRNQQYSIIALTSSTATIIERYAYTAYGAPTITDGTGTTLTTSAINNRTTYTGREWDDALTLYHYRARMYDANLGRFVGRDPSRYKGSPWNLYENLFAVNSTDPSGEAPLWRCIADRDACKREARANWRSCKAAGGRMCNVWLIFDLNFCDAKFASCVATDPRIVCGAVVCGVGAAVCCLDTPIPGPADCVGVPIVACGVAIMCYGEEEDSGGSL